MTEEQKDLDLGEDSQNPVQDELAALKSRANLMGIKFHPSIGLDNLRAKVNNALSDNPVPDDDDDEPDVDEPEEPEAPVVSTIPKPTELAAAAAPAPVATPAPAPAPRAPAPVHNEVPVKKAKETKAEAKYRLRREASRLVRINVINMNPLKSELEGEIITVGNSVIGTVSKYVHFNTTDGWHVPWIIYRTMKDRQCQIFVSKKVAPGKPATRHAKLIREFAIEVLDPLTPSELAELKQRQLMASGRQD